LVFKSHLMEIKAKIGLALRDIRETKNITQSVLATKSGIDRTFISHVENGSRNISIETLEKMLIGLGITFKDFFKRTDFN
jgi:transcriptional regulator with XRE-family HTH domain